MALVYAVKAGVWSDPTVWNTGVLPGVDDDVHSNTWTVNINQNIEVKSLSSRASGAAASGGHFRATASSSEIKADIYACDSYNDLWLNPAEDYFRSTTLYMGSEVTSLTVIGDFYGEPNNFYTVAAHVENDSGSIEIVGDVHIDDNGSQATLQIQGLGKVRLEGDIYCRSGTGTPALTIYMNAYNVFGEVAFIDDIGWTGHLAGLIHPMPGKSITFRTHLPSYDDLTPLTPIEFTIPPQAGSAEVFPADVRKGVEYGGLTGTLSVPSPEQVAFGVPVDNTVGNAAISLTQLSTITGGQIAAAFEK